MSLAPASSRGFFLNARFEVNGIQCAARSFGTLTELGRGLLSSMGGLFDVWGVGLRRAYQFRRQTGTPTRRDISAQIRDRLRRSRIPRPRNPRCRARAAAVADRRPP